MTKSKSKSQLPPPPHLTPLRDPGHRCPLLWRQLRHQVWQHVPRERQLLRPLKPGARLPILHVPVPVPRNQVRLPRNHMLHALGKLNRCFVVAAGGAAAVSSASCSCPASCCCRSRNARVATSRYRQKCPAGTLRVSPSTLRTAALTNTWARVSS